MPHVTNVSQIQSIGQSQVYAIRTNSTLDGSAVRLLQRMIATVLLAHKSSETRFLNRSYLWMTLQCTVYYAKPML